MDVNDLNGWAITETREKKGIGTLLLGYHYLHTNTYWTTGL